LQQLYNSAIKALSHETKNVENFEFNAVSRAVIIIAGHFQYENLYSPEMVETAENKNLTNFN